MDGTTKYNFNILRSIWILFSFLCFLCLTLLNLVRIWIGIAKEVLENLKGIARESVTSDYFASLFPSRPIL